MFYRIIAIVCTLLVVAVQEEIILDKNNNNNTLLSDLSRIDREITRRMIKPYQMRLRFSRLLQNSLKLNPQFTSLQNITILPSISIPYKDNIYYSMMLRQGSNYFTLRGDLIYSSNIIPALVSTIRNQHTYFAQQSGNMSWTIHKLKIANKVTQLQYQTMIDMKNYTGQQFKWFSTVTQSNSRHYILGGGSLLVVFDKNGIEIRKIQIQADIKQLQRLGSNLVILTDKGLIYYQLNKNMSRSDCQLPFGKIIQFKIDQSNLKYVYAKQEAALLQVQLTQNCKTTKMFDIYPTADFFPAGQLILVQGHQLRYAINISNDKTGTYQLPSSQCTGKSRLQVNRKVQSNFIISQICISQSIVILTHLLLQLQDSTNEITDFSKFRVPLLFLSFGIIIYVTVKNRSRGKTNGDQDQKSIEESLMKKITQLKESAEQQEDHKAAGSQMKQEATGTYNHNPTLKQLSTKQKRN